MARYLGLQQDGKCLVCRGTLEEGWHIHHLTWRTRAAAI
jgi:hypothetical protein